MKRQIKLTAASIGLTSAVITPIAMTIASSVSAYENDPYKITILQGQPTQTLNMFKTTNISANNSSVALWNAALFKGRPHGDANGGLETTLSIPKLKFKFDNSYDGVGEPTHRNWFRIPARSAGGYTFEGFTPDLASSLTLFGSPGGSNAAGMALRSNARFWNGDRITAEDFINTIKIALNVKNAVPWQWVISKTIGIKNAQKIIDAQTGKEKLSFEKALEKYPLGIYVSTEIEEEEMSNTPEGAAYYKKEYAEGRPRHSRIMYTFEGNNALDFVRFHALGPLGTPTQIRAYEKIGFENWGTSIDTLMGAGPYKLKYFDLDYKMIANKWMDYWDKDRVISPQIEIRVVPDQTTQIQLFKDGVAGRVSFGVNMLPQFLQSQELKRFIKPTQWMEVLNHMVFNTKAQRANSQYLLDPDFRNAILYSLDRQNYLSAIAADNSYAAEGFSTIFAMNDNGGQGVINNTMNFNNSIGLVDTTAFPVGNHVDEWNKLYHLAELDGEAGERDIFTRDELIVSSHDISKNEKIDRIHDPELAKVFFERFKTHHPEFNSINLVLQVDSTVREEVTTFKQNIEDNLQGVHVTLSPRPSNVEQQIAAEMNYDLRFTTWSHDYIDPWTYYHLLADKLTTGASDDAIIKSRMSRSIVSDGFTLVDYIAQRLVEDPQYFFKHYFNGRGNQDVANQIIAQFLRMEATIASDDPEQGQARNYDPAIWSQIPRIENDYEGYGNQFDKWTPYFSNLNPTSWDEKLEQFIEDNSTDDLWKINDYRFSILYPFIEKLIRDSGISTPVTRVKNAYIASRFIGEQNTAGRLNYFGYIYQADKIPASRYPLPGMEVIIG